MSRFHLAPPSGTITPDPILAIGTLRSIRLKDGIVWELVERRDRWLAHERTPDHDPFPLVRRARSD